MSTNTSSPSTFVEMEVPEVETPSWQPPVPIISRAYPPNYNQTSQPGTQVQFMSSFCLAVLQCKISPGIRM